MVTSHSVKSRGVVSLTPSVPDNLGHLVLVLALDTSAQTSLGLRSILQNVIHPTAETEASCEKTHQLLPNLLSCFVRSSVKSHQCREGQPPNTLLIGKFIPEAASAPPHPFPQGLKEPGFSSEWKAETSCVRVPRTTQVWLFTRRTHRTSM